MNDLDKITAEAAKKHYGGLPKGAREAARKMLAADIKAAIEKARQPLLEALLQVSDDLTCPKNDTHYCPNCDNSLFNAKARIDAVLLQSRAAHASDDNCRKCGRPLGWFEPGLCDNCRAGHASEPKPLERCSSNPHYEAHFGDEPAHASEKP